MTLASDSHAPAVSMSSWVHLRRGMDYANPCPSLPDLPLTLLHHVNPDLSALFLCPALQTPHQPTHASPSPLPPPPIPHPPPPTPTALFSICRPLTSCLMAHQTMQCRGWCRMQADFEHQVKLERQHNTELQRQNDQLTQAKVGLQAPLLVHAPTTAHTVCKLLLLTLNVCTTSAHIVVAGMPLSWLCQLKVKRAQHKAALM